MVLALYSRTVFSATTPAKLLIVTVIVIVIVSFDRPARILTELRWWPCPTYTAATTTR